MVTAAGEDVRRPPTRWRLGYYLLGVRLPEEYGRWVAEDVATYPRVRRLMAVRVLAFAPAIVGLAVVLEAPAMLGGLVGSLIASQCFPVRSREQVLKFQRIDGLGRPVPPRGLARLSNTAVWVATAVFVAVVVLAVSAIT